MADDDDERRRPWLWPGGWFRDEAFWRQVATATVSTLMTAGVAFLAARFAGIFAQVPWSTVCKTLVAGTVLVLVLVVVVLLLETGVATAERRIERRLLRRSNDLRANLDAIRRELDEMQAASGQD
jgi:type II secretory pathway component PulM